MEQKREKGIDEKFCSECGEVIRAKAEICPLCGVRQMAPPGSQSLFGSASAENGKSKLNAALLAIILGSFGAHKFYLGRVGTGILYIFIIPISTIIGVIEGITLLNMPDAEFNEKYGNI